MGSARPSLGKRHIGIELRRIRLEAKKHQKDVAAVIEVDPSLISKVEGGERALKVHEVEKILDFLAVQGDKRDELLMLAREARKRTRRMHPDPFTGAFRRIGDHEDDASEVYYFQGELIPGMLQTELYARSLISVTMSSLAEVGVEEIETRVRFRLSRQRLLDRAAPPRLWFVIGEAALLRPIGGAEVMRAQLLHLSTASERWPHVTIQVVPTAARDHPLLGGALTLFRFDGRVPDIVHQQTFIGGGVYVDNPEDTKQCFRSYDKLRAVALGPEDSRALIAERAAGYDEELDR
ncbi:helix-turn-helix transcriptional regulator [Actinosynnema pretiosum subsp. pretiosum]|uniref:Helix-turn-helix domain protein n=2 Tax=Actinosynnema TaxID=40566 RepID=C6WMC8_ACTMD|nr:helix-turn-helix transcriptional regulator [Actinosynnema mirum]ACU34862.1 helix-turn-helix domain protein [Actinosynnema mirum DSM 43827]AXX28229.1 helix-turn-helix domain protein [Actinosynnema pretiosum subsp. pretiosum]QUF07404.1 helix-turn-helix transcriptional regulator [Actinosynnema pretiosum subsp. pretiosum]